MLNMHTLASEKYACWRWFVSFFSQQVRALGFMLAVYLLKQRDIRTVELICSLQYLFIYRKSYHNVITHPRFSSDHESLPQQWPCFSACGTNCPGSFTAQLKFHLLSLAFEGALIATTEFASVVVVLLVFTSLIDLILLSVGVYACFFFPDLFYLCQCL